LRNVQLDVSLPPGAFDAALNPAWTAGAAADVASTIWPGQVSPGGTVSVQLLLPAAVTSGAVSVQVVSVTSGRHGEGAVPFPPTTVDLAAFNLNNPVQLQIPAA
jgi:hypothetical protein